MKREICFAILLVLALTIQSSEQARKKSDVVDDPSSEDIESVHTHFVHRLTRFLRFAGMINKISEDTGINKHEIVKAGKSEYQDQSSGRGRDYHAAHVVRAGEVSRRLQQVDEDEYWIVRNFLGHTDIVHRWNNEWSKVGGDIDRFQEANLGKVLDIDFSASLTPTTANTLRSLKADYIAILDIWIHITTQNNDDINKSNLVIAKQKIENLSEEDLLQHGKNGYLKEYRQPYSRPPILDFIYSALSAL